MIPVEELEAELLRMPAGERERLAQAAWASLEQATEWLADPANDPEGIALARGRDEEIESGRVEPITLEEFRHRNRMPGE